MTPPLLPRHHRPLRAERVAFWSTVAAVVAAVVLLLGYWAIVAEAVAR